MNDPIRKKPTILVVDDVPDDIRILEEILKGEYQVKAVTSGQATLKIVRGPAPPDLILLDIMMPDMDGFEVCRILKQDSATATIPIIFLTAKVMTEDEKLGFELGAIDYIRKPVDPDIVRTRIKAHLEQMDRTLRISEIRYRRLFETAQDGIMIVDLLSDGILDVNPALAAMVGLSQEAFLGKRISDMEFLRTIMSRLGQLSEIKGGNSIRSRNLPLETFDGRRIYVELIGTTYLVDGRELLQLNIRDITDLVVTERDRDTLAARLSHYLSTSPTITYSLLLKGGEPRWQWVSENIDRLLGYSSEEALEPGWWSAHVAEADREQALGMHAASAKGERIFGEYRFARKDGLVVWLHDEMCPQVGRGGESEIVGTLTDISERKEAEEEIHLKSAALEAAANAVIITDREGAIRWANQAFGALTGYSVEESIGKRPRDLVDSGIQGPDFYRQLWTTILSGKVWSGTLVNRKKTGSLYTEEMTITPVLDEAGAVRNFVAVKNDISERVLAEARLEMALRQKVGLLREIHHRVYNNMQVIISLLSISSQDILDPAMRLKIEDITRRMHAMAIIHQQFHNTDDLSHIDFAACLEQIIEELRPEFPANSVHASVERGTARVFLNLDQAIPAALIIGELLTNSLKFAFADGREPGMIRLTQRLEERDRLAIELRDDGVGLPADLDPGRARTLGMTLIRILSNQLGGVVEFRKGETGGTIATLKFTVVGDVERPV